MALAICSLVLKYHRQQIIKIVIIGGDPRVAGHDCFREACPERKTEQPGTDTTS